MSDDQPQTVSVSGNEMILITVCAIVELLTEKVGIDLNVDGPDKERFDELFANFAYHYAVNRQAPEQGGE